MEYSKIIEPYLIDFDKLEVGQTLWSVTDGKVEIHRIERKFIVLTNKYFYFTDGRLVKTDKYPTLFTSNPFEGLQRVEPKKIWNKPHTNFEKVEDLQVVNEPNKIQPLESADSSISEQTVEVEAEKLADKYVFETNGNKWSNNDNTAGDNFGSFKDGFLAGAEYAQKSTKEVETIKNAKTLLEMFTSLDSEVKVMWSNEQINAVQFISDLIQEIPTTPTQEQLIELWNETHGTDLQPKAI